MLTAAGFVYQTGLHHQLAERRNDFAINEPGLAPKAEELALRHALIPDGLHHELANRQHDIAINEPVLATQANLEGYISEIYIGGLLVNMRGVAVKQFRPALEIMRHLSAKLVGTKII